MNGSHGWKVFIPFAEHAITGADLDEPTDMTKVTLKVLLNSIDA